MSTPAEARRAYAKHLAALAGPLDSRIEEAFATVPREAFLGPGPWTLIDDGGFVATPDADPIRIYRNVLVVLDAEKGINNGEPLLHAMWMARVAPQPGETVIHIGAGSGYYAALLSLLVVPGGHVTAYEIDAALAARASTNLHPYAGSVSVIHGDAATAALPRADVIYVNAGVTAPPPPWLEALKPGGRLVFPWRPAERVGLAVAVTRTAYGYACEPFMPSWFIACAGISVTAASLTPSLEQAARSRSIWLACGRPPDDTATAIFPDVWFSERPVPHS